MTDPNDFFVKFWGVRGSIACPGPDTVRYGGNTTCIEIRCGGELIIIDGGTGLRDLGAVLAGEKLARIDLFFTHTHFDHVCGVPFFLPAYMKGTDVNFWAGHLENGQTIKGVLCDMMIAPLFPVPLQVFASAFYHDFTCGTPMQPKPGVRLNTCRLNHPNNACGYRIDFDGRSICIITDTEHRLGEIDQVIVDFVAGADIMVYDAMYTDEEYPKHISWGHSTWQEALRIADAAGVGRAVLFHHEPAHDDAFMDAVAAAAEARRPGTLVAVEGMVLRP
jgi:phosphoribosyl 1,2-cyclic phosphodiesterase